MIKQKLHALGLSILLCCILINGVQAQWKGQVKGTQKASKYIGKNTTPNPSMDKPQQRHTSTFHAQHEGEIVFSNQIISKSNPGAQLSTQFQASDWLYARIFSAKSAQNTDLKDGATGEIFRCSSCMYYFDVFVDGQKQDFVLDEYYITDADEKQWTTRQLWIHPRPEDEPTAPSWINLINQLPPGKHEIRLEYRIKNPDNDLALVPSAVGTFTLTKRAGENLKIGKSWQDIRAGMQNSILEKQILQLTNADYSMTKDGSKYTSVKILSKNWRIVHHRVSGIPSYRWVEVNIKQIRADGSCYVQNHAVRQSYTGSGYDSAVRWAGIQELDGFGGPIDCQ